MSDSSGALLGRYEDGDSRAAEELFSRYVERLTRLARARLSPKLARRVDPEDIVLSAYRSFFIGARRGQFSLRRSGDLWSLLVTLTLRKLYRTADHHQAQMRSIDAECNLRDGDLLTSRGPTPEEAIALADDLELVMSQLPPLGRRVLELRLQGESHEQIADAVHRSQRTVRRMLKLAGEHISRLAAEE